MGQFSEQQIAPSVAYETYLRNGDFRLQVCADCGRQVYFARTICHHCGSGDLRWEKPSGLGTVYSTTVVRRKADRGGDYNVAIIELAEGARMMSCVDGVAPGEVRIGMPVYAEIATDNGKPLVVFRPKDGAG